LNRGTTLLFPKKFLHNKRDTMAKDIEIIEIKLEKKLQEIKALLLQLLKHDEHSESKTSYSSYSLFLFFCMLF